MKAKRVFAVRDKRLTISDGDTGDVVWSGLLFDTPVTKVAQAADGSSALVVLDAMAMPMGLKQNLVYFDSHGDLLWQSFSASLET